MKTIGELFADPYMAAGLTCMIVGYTLAAVIVWGDKR